MRSLLLWSVLFVVCSGVVSAADVVLVSTGKAEAQIVVADGAPEQVKQAARTLSDYLREASGAALPVIEETALLPDTPGQLVLVGQTRRWPVTFPQGFDGDGFTILARGRAVSICGPTDWGTEFGVYDFLERYVGVRWLLPGDDGVDIPRQETIRVPEGRVQDQPVFFSRLYSGLRGPAQGNWARFNRMHGRVSFHHNLLHVFPVKKYKDTHPEFYPVFPTDWRGHTPSQEPGQRYLPLSDTDENWQPCLTASGSVDEAARNIINHFNAHPQESSFSLGMNDSGRFCLCDSCRARISGKKNYLGWLDYSDLYYDWCNQVIERVLKVHPDKWFGCLAYFNVATPPQQVKVHPRLVPYITYDRMKWLDPRLREAGHAATRDWQAKVPTFAWYDYLYGTPYCLPRIYTHHAAEYLRFGASNGVKAHYGEIYPNFGEGPKPYVHLKLWWNPGQNVDALQKEWYERCVGPQAAPYLAKYYALWERFWTTDVLTSDWFKDAGTWLPFNSPAYLEIVQAADITRSRELLEATIARAGTDKQRARARLLEKAFQYYEASALAYLLSRSARAPRSEPEALAALDSGLKALEMAHKRRHLSTEVFPNDPVLLHPLGFESYNTPSGIAWGGGTIWSMANWVRRGDNAVRRRMEDLAKTATSEIVREQAQLVLRVVDGHTTVVSHNPSFEEGEGEGSADWGYWLKPDEPPAKPIGRMARSRDVAHSGEHSLMYDGVWRGAPVQTIEFPGAGQYAAVAWVYIPAGQTHSGTLDLTVTPLNEAGGNLPAFETRVEPTAGEWSLTVFGIKLPETVGGQRIRHLRLLPLVNGYEGGGKVYWDDVGLYRVD